MKLSKGKGRGEEKRGGEEGERFIY